MGSTVDRGGMGRGQDEQEFNGRDEDKGGARTGTETGGESEEDRAGRMGSQRIGFTRIHWNSLGSLCNPSTYWKILGICSRLVSLIHRQVHPQ